MVKDYTTQLGVTYSYLQYNHARECFHPSNPKSCFGYAMSCSAKDLKRDDCDENRDSSFPIISDFQNQKS